MPRPQFTLRALLIAVLVVAAFFGGMAVQRRLEQPVKRYRAGIVEDSGERRIEVLVLRDGTRWTRELASPLDE
jgi:ferric-dicitrate binding protein FerR (iron transport regulator)